MWAPPGARNGLERQGEWSPRGAVHRVAGGAILATRTLAAALAYGWVRRRVSAFAIFACRYGAMRLGLVIITQVLWMAAVIRGCPQPARSSATSLRMSSSGR